MRVPCGRCAAEQPGSSMTRVMCAWEPGVILHVVRKLPGGRKEVFWKLVSKRARLRLRGSLTFWACATFCLSCSAPRRCGTSLPPHGCLPACRCMPLHQRRGTKGQWLGTAGQGGAARGQPRQSWNSCHSIVPSPFSSTSLLHPPRRSKRVWPQAKPAVPCNAVHQSALQPHDALLASMRVRES